MEVLAELPRPGHYLLRNPLTRPDGFFLTRVGARASCHALIPITVELMLPVMYTQEADATCHVYSHRQPIILASAYSPTYPSSGFHCLALWNQYFQRRRHPVPDIYSPHTYSTNSHGSAFDVRGEPFGSPLRSRRNLRQFPNEFPCTGARPWGAPMTRASRHLFESNRSRSLGYVLAYVPVSLPPRYL